ncbi:GCN5-related N-acetyltransferase 10, chloroplastic [Rutidosis leptorrhynchoides]|uniref:GCN5-related N-acetyltransferase 10, chloroplastic n=1 Tax=Rutidosis leptorrhynchoides TaxID=125765 RepID=UPI003A997571
MATLYSLNSFTISMKLCAQLPFSFNQNPPQSFNLFLSIKHPRSLFIQKVNKSQQFCKCSSVSSSSQQVEDLVADVGGGGGGGGDEGWDGKYNDDKGQFGNLVKEYGWQVRRMDEKDDEMRSVANIQAEAFYEPVILFNDVFFQFFQAEVLSGLLYRLKNSPPDRYACLVAESIASDNEENRQMVGVVDLMVFRDQSVLVHLSGADEYLYVSGIAVLRNFRRKKVASALLKACEMVAIIWGYKYLVLRAYEDDFGARNLYMRAGYKIVSGDPVWTTSWIGRRRRILMIKECNTT